MKLYINKQIVKEQQKEMLFYFTGEEGVSYADINAFLENVPEDEQIDVELYSCGGDCTEGFAIYDALRTCGHPLTSTVIGECASMATIIALCAPKENRRAYKHSRFLIHEPYYPDCVQGDITLQRAEQLKSDLEDEKAKMVAIYVERTGTSEEDIVAQLEEGVWFDATRAIELGFISEIVPETSAAISKENISTTINDNSENSMKENEAKGLLQRLGEMLGLSSSNENMVALQLTSTDGTELTIEREEGDIQVGDNASPDGTYTLEDGRTITIAGGKITEIKEPTETEEIQEEREVTIEETENNALIDELRKALDELKGELEVLKSDNVALKADLANANGLLKTLPVGKVNLPVNEKPAASVEMNVFDMIKQMNKK